jgi:hypothetical protein
MTCAKLGFRRLKTRFFLSHCYTSPRNENHWSDRLARSVPSERPRKTPLMRTPIPLSRWSRQGGERHQAPIAFRTFEETIISPPVASEPWAASHERRPWRSKQQRPQPSATRSLSDQWPDQSTTRALDDRGAGGVRGFGPSTSTARR